MTPWDVLARQITRLNDRIDLLPSIREAAVTATSPLTVTFDTDTVGTVVFGTLAAGLQVGDRVLTARLARYVWVLGRRGGTSDTGWINLTAAAGWSSNSLAYRVRGGRVELKGEIWGGPDGSTAFTMPEGARPVARRAAMAPRIANSPTLFGFLFMQTTGVVTFVNAGSGGIPSGSPGYAVAPIGGYSNY